MPTDYIGQLNGKRKLNEIVIPGAHDAGVYTDVDDHIRTQKHNIYEQAKAGVRFYDVRIGDSGGTLTAFHGQMKSSGDKFKKIKLPGAPKMGDWGDDLDGILEQSKTFLSENKKEFIILKFSKSYRWDNIKNAINTKLGAQYHFRQDVNLNETLVNDLKGKVITLFPNGEADSANGFLPFHELLKKKRFKGTSCAPYAPAKKGLQYFGKYSDTKSITTNAKGQAKNIKLGRATANPKVVGVMYWTTTGLTGNIRDRDKPMWRDTNIRALQDTWRTGLADLLVTEMGDDFFGSSKMPYSLFMPNIVMMDFASERRCQIVFELNKIPDQEILKLALKTDLAADIGISFN